MQHARHVCAVRGTSKVPEQTRKNVDTNDASVRSRRATVRSWAQFERKVRRSRPKLLHRLDDYETPILVAGCQRSGTTVVTRMLRDALGMPDTAATSDDELDAALILAGSIDHPYRGRCVFQTTYVNDAIDEYFEHDNYRLVWILRHPHAVVQSMLFNWRRGALRRLFRHCGSQRLPADRLQLLDRYGTLPFSRLDMACYSYAAKTAQTHELIEHLDNSRLLIIDYDDLLNRPADLTAEILRFSGLPVDNTLGDRLKRSKKSKKERLSTADKARVDELCLAEYREATSARQSLGSNTPVSDLRESKNENHAPATPYN